MSRRTRRTFQPRFFFFLALSVALVVGIVLLSSAAVDYFQERKKQSELDLPVNGSASPEEGVGSDGEGQTASVVQKRRLSMEAAYVVTGSDRDGMESSVRVNNEDKVRDGAPREIFSRVEELHALGLASPETVELLHELKKSGMDLPLDAITVEECADAIVAALQEEKEAIGTDHSR